jgi:hypothetical protein
MNDRGNPYTDQKLSLLAGEILYWNEHINLVSRVDSENRVNDLITHCRQGWDLVREALGGWSRFRSCLYMDIGSGAGLPGLVWAALRERESHQGPSLLVEPRKKRAWFLKKAIRVMGLSEVTVAEHRWGEEGIVLSGLVDLPLMISMKAIDLHEHQVLAGARARIRLAGRPAITPSEVVLLRFLSPKGSGKQGGVAAESPDGDRRDAVRPSGYRLVEARILGSGVPRLGLWHYVDPGDDDVPRGTSKG